MGDERGACHGICCNVCMLIARYGGVGGCLGGAGNGKTGGLCASDACFWAARAL